MKQLKNVFMFEFLEMIQKKAVIITTAIIAIIFFGITFLPALASNGSSDPGTDTPEQTDLSHIVFVTDAEYHSEDELSGAFGVGIETLGTEAEALEAVESGSYEKAVIITGRDSYRLIAQDLGTFDNDEFLISSVIESLASAKNLADMGINAEQAMDAMNVSVQVDYELLGRDSGQGFFVAYVIMFILYFLCLFFGQSVSTSVAREKDSRTMELLITSTSTDHLILGKVFAMGSAGILQMGIIISAGVIGFFINQNNYPDEIIALLSSTLSIDVILIYLLFSIVGYILYLFIYAALGSLVSKVEDVGSAITPVTFLFVFAFFMATFSLQAPDSTAVVISSFIPFVSLFTMPIRYMLTTVASWQLILSVVFLILGVVLIEKLSVYIYRFGSLNYGNKIKFSEVFKSLKKSS